MGLLEEGHGTPASRQPLTTRSHWSRLRRPSTRAHGPRRPSTPQAHCPRARQDTEVSGAERPAWAAAWWTRHPASSRQLGRGLTRAHLPAAKCVHSTSHPTLGRTGSVAG